jgi:hypothetical protein
MSGPIAATFGLDAGIAIAAAEVIRAALVIAEGYGDEQARQAALAGERAAEADARRLASRAGRQALAEAVAREESRLARLGASRELLGARLNAALPAAAPLPPRPADADHPALAGYLEILRRRTEALTREVQELARHSADLPAADLSVLIAAAPNLADQLAAFEIRQRLAAQLPAAVLAERRALVARVLERALLAEGVPLPEDLASLADELMATASAERAEALASELRLRVARHNETTTAAAAALVLEQSLRDLGYEVDGIGETLFVEGGVAHFQQAGWGDYQVRLRVDAQRASLNFNVVRAGSAGEDRRHEDMMAEERWCAEFPKLQATLAARGFRIAVTRMLGAGEVPVQVVPATSLPRLAGDDERPRAATPRTMHTR